MTFGKKAAASAPVKIIGEFRALMCERDRTAVTLPDERDVVTNLSGHPR